ncbi:MAG TPA: dTDP-4-dehydrorhamnose 3,5-epimerase family protein [Pyrinomonadaceae bacterium]|nr:dTDP-4-dehydrorhamnose 3,5-epimerase family protein [Pyrinomonadaceae bacterium]
MQPKREATAVTFKAGAIDGVRVRDIQKHTDERGWLAELFRHDEMAEEFYPQMAYVSESHPNVQRGPHEHMNQADFFCFIGPSSFKLRLWDNRTDSDTYRNVMTLILGEDNPKSVLVPKGVVHAYRNVGRSVGLVLNFPNRLYMGAGRREEVDVIRHEDYPRTIFNMDETYSDLQ